MKTYSYKLAYKSVAVGIARSIPPFFPIVRMIIATNFAENGHFLFLKSRFDKNLHL
jgi:hypothetical protein